MALKEKRREEYKNSELPYCFSYKIRNHFNNKPCPICGAKMGRFLDSPKYQQPSIQHNKPLSKGGKHELSNISVVCFICNVSIQDQETGPLNNAEVVTYWEAIRKKARA